MLTCSFNSFNTIKSFKTNIMAYRQLIFYHMILYDSVSTQNSYHIKFKYNESWYLVLTIYRVGIFYMQFSNEVYFINLMVNKCVQSDLFHQK